MGGGRVGQGGAGEDGPAADSPYRPGLTGGFLRPGKRGSGAASLQRQAGRFGTGFNYRMVPPQTATSRLLLLAAARFCEVVGPNAIQRCTGVPDRIHLRA